jgi:hypothetical protein
MRADGKTDGSDMKLMVAFLDFAKAPEITKENSGRDVKRDNEIKEEAFKTYSL